MEELPKIVQMMPAPGWRALYRGTTNDERSYMEAILVGWGLYDNGEIFPLTVDYVSGMVDNPANCSNFVRLLDPTEPHF